MTQEISDFFAHPFILLVAGAIITSAIIPWLTNRWQNHKKKIEIKIDLVSRISETVILCTHNIATILLNKKQIEAGTITESKEWVSKGKIVGAYIRAYFKNSSLPNEWDKFFEMLWDYWGFAMNLADDSIQKISIPTEFKTHFSYIKDINWQSIESKKNFIDDLVKLDNSFMNETHTLIEKIINEPIRSF